MQRIFLMVMLLVGVLSPYSIKASELVLTASQQRIMIREATYQRKLALDARAQVADYVSPKDLTPQLGKALGRWAALPFPDIVKANELSACSQMTADVYTLSEVVLHADWLDVAQFKNREFKEDSKRCDMALADPAKAFAALSEGLNPIRVEQLGAASEVRGKQ